MGCLRISYKPEASNLRVSTEEKTYAVNWQVWTRGKGENFGVSGVDQSSGGGPTWVDNTVDWIGDNANQLGVTVAAGLNAYAGFEEVKAGAAMLLAPTGVTQVAGVYAIADGIVRMVSAPIQIYGTWTGNTSLENAPHNLLGAAGSLIGPNAQTWMGVGGDFGLSRMKLIQIATKGFSNPNTLMRMKDIGNAGWQIVRPYKDAIQKGLK